ncbi:hypothetical protein JG687_00018627 [Phytophthora cactorum]|uniref:Uncharacterized protein n=1 Tax=Phytophthora cactorum TaxID=29920 RepID=A0A329S169_9STRA|nr:hypothetical protein PC112_g17774 [Phytophthora cactorum]KAG2823474.1 hypothetical protein PC111_g10213 [Phytophthora cactorum]KAG2847566.1 hypothetical protein PC113_g17751 [Phytophthora cactorum]KAG2904781.1 hypothetical protein PC114_g11771 [Phytophthora cactorum]KAG2912356.1 hypothetical protein PC117_g18922 [Phytophthora cactorum]
MTLLVTCVKTPEDWEKARAIRLHVFIHEQKHRRGVKQGGGGHDWRTGSVGTLTT